MWALTEQCKMEPEEEVQEAEDSGQNWALQSILEIMEGLDLSPS